MTNLPDSMSGAARGLTKGVTYTVHLVSSEAATRVHAAQSRLILRLGAEVDARSRFLGKAIDHYFAYRGAAAPSPLDGAVQGYREVTGAAPLYAKFAYGFCASTTRRRTSWWRRRRRSVRRPSCLCDCPRLAARRISGLGPAGIRRFTPTLKGWWPTSRRRISS